MLMLRCIFIAGVLAFNLPLPAASPRPNVILLVADDLGYSDLGCFGSEISTPNIDRLATEGVVFANFHTAAACSPTRAMLLTGVDHHLAGMGTMVEFQTDHQTGRPGYEGHLNDRVVCLAQLFKEAGYYTAMAGKWHLGWTDQHMPATYGFERSWNLMQGHSDHYEPTPTRHFYADGKEVQYPVGRYSTEWYTDKAIEYLRETHDQGAPFFLYVAYTAPHWPLQAPPEKIQKYRGKYAQGYDWLREQRIRGLVQKGIIPEGLRIAPATRMRPYLHETVPVRQFQRDWDELPPAFQAIEASKMEVYAAMVDELDEQVGRLIRVVKELGEYDDTLILFMSDNGAAPSEVSGFGYGPDWARASSGPFRLVKGYPTEGGTRCPLIVKMPGGSAPRISAEFASVLDIAPTLYDLAQIEYPDSHGDDRIVPLQGASMLQHLKSEGVAIHEANYGIGWELFDRAAYRQGNWKIVSIEQPFGTGNFELFDLSKDPGETDDLSGAHPEVFRQMLAKWESYARDMNVIPASDVDGANESSARREE
jgi:arylsulfatase